MKVGRHRRVGCGFSENYRILAKNSPPRTVNRQANGARALRPGTSSSAIKVEMVISTFILTRMVQRSKVSNALQPRSPRSSRVDTQSQPDMTRFHNVGSLLQPVPQARETRIPHTETHAKRVCAQRWFVSHLRVAERST
jgi:hypothetical protein